MSKTLDTTGITNELQGASAFFSPAPVKRTARKRWLKKPASPQATKTEGFSQKKEAPVAPATKQESGKSEEQASTTDSRQAIERARYQASNHSGAVETIRRSVKDPGGKTTFVRLTPEEKNRLVDLVYTYKRQGIKTSENELVRIAIGCLLEDYQANGQESMLAHVIEALNA